MTAVFTVADLERALGAVEPAALLVPPRVLRRVIKKDAGLTGPGLQAPHRKSYVLGRDALLHIADRDDLGVRPGRELPETLLLFPRPDPAKLRALPPGATLLRYWRLLFHARVHQAVGKSLGAGAAEAAVRERVRVVGQAEADEARAVLRQENLLLHSHNLRSVYEEFAAVFLELHYFAPHRLPYYFPAITDLAAVRRVLDGDVRAAELFAATRPEGAADPAPATTRAEEGDAPAWAERTPAPGRPDPAAHARLTAAAERTGGRGNLVRAALLLERAQRAATPEQAPATRAAVAAALERLDVRLQAALGYPQGEAAEWRRVLTLLVGPASSGAWTREGRLLYDLQRVCIDQEREVFAVDLVEWVVTWGRRPVVRLLPHQRQVNLVRRLRGAVRRAAASGLPEADRKQFLHLLHDAVRRQEEQLRDRFRPLLLDSLEDSGLRPRDAAERVSRDQVIEELLDGVVDRGFLTLGDLRDALAPQAGRPVRAGRVPLRRPAPPRQPQAGRFARRRLPPRRNLPPLAATTQLARLRHAGRALPDTLPGPAVRRRLPGPGSLAARRPPRRPHDRRAAARRRAGQRLLAAVGRRLPALPLPLRPVPARRLRGARLALARRPRRLLRPSRRRDAPAARARHLPEPGLPGGLPVRLETSLLERLRRTNRVCKRRRAARRVRRRGGGVPGRRAVAPLADGDARGRGFRRRRAARVAALLARPHPRPVPGGPGLLPPAARRRGTAALRRGRMAALPRRRRTRVGGRQGGARSGLVLRDLRHPLLPQPAGRAADQPDQAFPRGHGVAQAGADVLRAGDGAGVGTDPGPGAGRDGRGGDRLRHPRRLRLSGLGVEGELAALPGQPAAGAAPAGGGGPRRDRTAAVAAGLPFGHIAQALRPAAARRGGRPGQAARGIAPRRGGDAPFRGAQPPGGPGRVEDMGDGDAFTHRHYPSCFQPRPRRVGAAGTSRPKHLPRPGGTRRPGCWRGSPRRWNTRRRAATAGSTP